MWPARPWASIEAEGARMVRFILSSYVSLNLGRQRVMPTQTRPERARALFEYRDVQTARRGAMPFSNAIRFPELWRAIRPSGASFRPTPSPVGWWATRRRWRTYLAGGPGAARPAPAVPL